MTMNTQRHNGKFTSYPVPPKAELEHYYLDEVLNPYKMSEKLHVSSNTVRRWLKHYGIPLRKDYESGYKAVLTNEEKAYLAGYLDGDGSINIGLTKNPHSKRGLNPHTDVTLITKNREFAEQLASMLEIGFRIFTYHDSRVKKECYKIGFSRQASQQAFLIEILPFLRLKRKQSELMVEYVSRRKEDKSRLGASAPISDRCWELIYEIRRLNE